MKATFEKTIDILVKAYLNDTLEHANCTACAVGNLVAHAKGVKPTKDKDRWRVMSKEARFSDGSIPNWHLVFCSKRPREQSISPGFYRDVVKTEIDATGYTWQELARIEYAFEQDCDRHITASGSAEENDAQMFQGLMNVVNVLADIHGVSLEQKQEAISMFTKSHLSLNYQQDEEMMGI